MWVDERLAAFIDMRFLPLLRLRLRLRRRGAEQCERLPPRPLTHLQRRLRQLCLLRERPLFLPLIRYRHRLVRDLRAGIVARRVFLVVES